MPINELLARTKSLNMNSTWKVCMVNTKQNHSSSHPLF